MIDSPSYIDQAGLKNSSPEYFTEFFFIPNNYEYVKVILKDILYLEADGSYVKIFTTKNHFQLSINLKHLAVQLPSADFVRVSRKHIVNIRYAQRINGSEIYMDCGKKLPYSKRGKQEMLTHFPILKVKH
ncbi:MAG: DNA-binding LytR/AlgR family response regulator [Cyclobacteriaceae bacterium]|jgi:DNA-binding LytR/AlgR family response regulator